MRYLEPVYENLHDFRYEGGARINGWPQITLVIEKKEYGPSYRTQSFKR